MKICEIFASIQGESTYAGLPCVFVRLSGCNLRCRHCDTVYAYEDGAEMSEDKALKTVLGFGIDLVEITGGEPLLQSGSLGLMGRLLEKGFTVLLETNGSISIRDVDRRVVVIMDIKTPGSGMLDKMDLLNLKYLKHSDELKFVVHDRGDYDWVKEFIKDYGLKDKCKILLSPAYGVLQTEKLAGWIVEDRLPVRLNLQIHKLIYGPDERGV